MKFSKCAFFFLSPFMLFACAEDEVNVADIQETGQQIGDVMASVDESGGTSDGTMAFMEGQRKFMAVKQKQLPRNIVEDVFDLFTPIKSAQAVACKDTTYSACTSSAKVRDLAGCTIGSAEFTGDITLNFSNASCLMSTNGNRVDRNPNFTVTGRRDATLTVSKTGSIGQRMERTGTNSFAFSNDGIRRVFSANGVDLFDFTTTTTTNITVTGTSRSDRVMTGGTLRVANNKTSVTCDYSPSNVAWSSSCNCASSGTWSGSCSDGKTSELTITGCGTATLTVEDSSESLQFDRCYSN
jgi:hypothetical protein